MDENLSQKIRDFVSRKAHEALPEIAEYFASDSRTSEHPAVLVLHPSGSIDVQQSDIDPIIHYPSAVAPVTPATTESELVALLLSAWKAKESEMSDYPLSDEN